MQRHAASRLLRPSSSSFFPYPSFAAAAPASFRAVRAAAPAIATAATPYRPASAGFPAAPATHSTGVSRRHFGSGWSSTSTAARLVASSSPSAREVAALARRAAEWVLAPPAPPPNPALALAGVAGFQLDDLRPGDSEPAAGITGERVWDGLADLLGGLWHMAVPKSRVTRSKKRIKNYRKRIVPDLKNIVTCPKCGSKKLLHHICQGCLAKHDEYWTKERLAEARLDEQKRLAAKRVAKQQAAAASAE